jgi:hypothetical protein
MLGHPLWFIIALGIFCFLLITGTYRRISIGKIALGVNKLSVENKNKFVNSYRNISKILKIMFYMIPLNLIVIPFAVYKYDANNFLYFFLTECLVYIVITDDYFFRSSILKRIKDGERTRGH